MGWIRTKSVCRDSQVCGVRQLSPSLSQSQSGWQSVNSARDASAVSVSRSVCATFAGIVLLGTMVGAAHRGRGIGRLHQTSRAGFTPVVSARGRRCRGRDAGGTFSVLKRGSEEHPDMQGEGCSCDKASCGDVDMQGEGDEHPDMQGEGWVQRPASKF